MSGSSRSIIYLPRVILLILVVLSSVGSAHPQSSEEELDPIKLFERGQDAHAHGDFERAIALYDEALALRPEFPEAEYQRASALVSLGRLQDAEKSLRRAAELRPEWALPFALLGDVLVRQRRYTEAEAPLASALKLEPANSLALTTLVELRLHTKSSREALIQLLTQVRAATIQKGATAGLWLARGSVERTLGDNAEALKSFERSLSLDSRSIAAYIGRAEILAGTGDLAAAIESVAAALRISPESVNAATSLARFYLQAGKCGEATRTLDDLDIATKRPAESSSLRSVITLECATGDKERTVLEAALAKDPRNPEILERLCRSHRVDDPPRALEYCRRALEIQPTNVDYGSTYAAALVQARRFSDAVTILKRVLAVAPDRFVAHANLALALYELGRFPEALAEYKWIIGSKPETTAAYFFVAVIYDRLGEYQRALEAYQQFLARADPAQFKLEIDKVNLRLPPLLNQIKRGQGVKKKK